MLKRMNKSWGKGENVKTDEVARLLHMHHRVSDCSSFCAASGLPVEDGHVVFKMQPVERNTKAMRRSRGDDQLVFGTETIGNALFNEIDSDGISHTTYVFNQFVFGI
jgi:hypothetical protein